MFEFIYFSLFDLEAASCLPGFYLEMRAELEDRVIVESGAGVLFLVGFTGFLAFLTLTTTIGSSAIAFLHLGWVGSFCRDTFWC
jgi:hypothetical protein